MKHFLCRHIFIYMCVMFLCAMWIFVVCLILKVLYRSIMALSWTRVGEADISRMANLRKIFVIAPLDTNFPRPPAHRQTSTFARQRVQTVMSAARERKIARFFCTPQRAGIQRVAPVSREIPENFSKISSPKIWCVCQKSVPLHSQNRNEAYNTSRI